jgi:hypothetical protein
MKRLLIGCALVLLCATALVAQTPPAEKTAKHDCAAMMQKHEGMQKHMAEMDAKLQGLVDDMNKATGEARVDKMAAVLNELVTQRAMLQKHMTSMCPMMKEGEKSSEHHH